MNINRHTYEEYFLMYIDNELTVQERNVVEVFIQQNPDLKQELVWLKESMLTADKIIFTDKASLLKSDAIHTDLQEKLLLLIDGELDTTATASIAEQIANDAALKNEWELLKQTKLPADDRIVFEHKNLLYINEDSKLVAMRWWKIAVAAMLIGAGLWGTVNYFQNKSTTITTLTASNIPITKAANTNKKVENKVDIPGKENEETNTALNTIEQNKSSNKEVAAIVAAKTMNTNKLENSMQVTIEKQQLVAQAIQPSNNLPKSYLENINNDQRNKNDVVSVPTVKRDIPTVIDNSTNIADVNSIASNASFTENNKANNNITYGFDEEEEQPKKSKVGGFFKKLNRVLQRNAKLKTNSDKSINVANLSFAIQ
jgi:hypothetical protein